MQHSMNTKSPGATLGNTTRTVYTNKQTSRLPSQESPKDSFPLPKANTCPSKPSNARCRALYNPTERAFIANQMFTPRRGHNSAEPVSLPSLSQWSDITFLEWYYNQVASKAGGLSAVPYPKVIIIPEIVNAQAQTTINSALDRSSGKRLESDTGWDNRVEFTTRTEIGNCGFVGPECEGCGLAVGDS